MVNLDSSPVEEYPRHLKYYGLGKLLTITPRPYCRDFHSFMIGERPIANRLRITPARMIRFLNFGKALEKFARENSNLIQRLRL